MSYETNVFGAIFKSDPKAFWMIRLYDLQLLPFPATISTSHKLLFVFVRSSLRLARSRKAYVVECEMLSRSEDGLSIPALSLPTLSGFISGTIGLWASYSGFCAILMFLYLTLEIRLM